MPKTALDADELRAQVAEHDWYHTLELAPGVLTPGYFDTRGAPAQLPFPPSLAGRRCLDVGTFDGFWAFEMERRGADEVVAIDVIDPKGWDWPADGTEATAAALNERKAGGAGFELAHRALGSRVRRVELSVYDVAGAGLGEFDFIYLGSLLLHLRDPVLALQRLRSVSRGRLLVVDAIEPFLTLVTRRPVATLDGRGRPWWWKPNLAGLVRMVEAAGWRPVAGPRRIHLPLGPQQQRPRATLRRLLDPVGGGWEAFAAARRGFPHGAVLAEPAP